MSNAAELRADELREAADDVERFLAGEDTEFDLTETAGRLVDAARNIALPILEADPELVIEILWRHLGEFIAPASKGADGAIQAAAEEILTAIKTPTPGAGESL